MNNRIMIGYDKREVEAYNACVRSIKENTSSIVDIDPIIQQKLIDQKIYSRLPDPLSSTEFSFTRFLVPYLCDYKGWTVFCDCDFIFQSDIDELFQLKDDRYAVLCCKHNYTPTATTKMDNQKQHLYPRKNWSSLILWNCNHPKNKTLTPDIINTQTGQYLHRFMWLEDEDIGSLPLQWNWLVGWYKEPIDGIPKALHFTEGGPWFEQYKNCEYSDVYNKYKYD